MLTKDSLPGPLCPEGQSPVPFGRATPTRSSHTHKQSALAWPSSVVSGQRWRDRETRVGWPGCWEDGWKVGHTDWWVKGQLRREDGGSDGWWTDNWVIWGRKTGGWVMVGQRGGWTDNGYITGKGQTKAEQWDRWVG